MTDNIREKFEELHPYRAGSNKILYESLYAIFKEGWENGKACAEIVSQPRLGYYIYTIDCDDWGCKIDGFMVGFTIEDLKKRQVNYEAHNNNYGGQYYKRPNEFIPVELTPEAVKKLEEEVDTFNCVWFDREEQFMKGE
jgi:hypothetical protein|nr:MAG TPA: hypothetical protein [Caudoviricetes sp.]